MFLIYGNMAELLSGSCQNDIVYSLICNYVIFEDVFTLKSSQIQRRILFPGNTYFKWDFFNLINGN